MRWLIEKYIVKIQILKCWAEKKKKEKRREGEREEKITGKTAKFIIDPYNC
jgi:hypothetical protein